MMRIRRHHLCFILLWVFFTPAEGTSVSKPVVNQELTQAQNLHQDIIKLCHQLWTQLASITTKQEADAAAPLFEQDASRLAQLDQQLQRLEEQKSLSSEIQTFMKEVEPSIIDIYIRLGQEFNSLYAAHCLQSSTLQKAFDSVLREGFFYAEAQPKEPTKNFFNKEEEQLELARLCALKIPDLAALKCLSCVKDASSAKDAVTKLAAPIKHLHQLRPKPELAHHTFHPKNKNLFIHAARPLEITLWDIRQEYVRIASNFAPNSNDFNNLANTLDELYLSLEETHPYIFPLVFDDSFIADMDAAYDKHNATTQSP